MEPHMLETVIDQRRKDLGGFEVGRVLPHAARRMVGPIIFLDHIGPVDFPRGISNKARWEASIVKTPYSPRRSQSNRRCDKTTPCS